MKKAIGLLIFFLSGCLDLKTGMNPDPLIQVSGEITHLVHRSDVSRPVFLKELGRASSRFMISLGKLRDSHYEYLSYDSLFDETKPEDNFFNSLRSLKHDPTNSDELEELTIDLRKILAFAHSLYRQGFLHQATLYLCHLQGHQLACKDNQKIQKNFESSFSEYQAWSNVFQNKLDDTSKNGERILNRTPIGFVSQWFKSFNRELMIQIIHNPTAKTKITPKMENFETLEEKIEELIRIRKLYISAENDSELQRKNSIWYEFIQDTLFESTPSIKVLMERNAAALAIRNSLYQASLQITSSQSEDEQMSNRYLSFLSLTLSREISRLNSCQLKKTMTRILETSPSTMKEVLKNDENLTPHILKTKILFDQSFDFSTISKIFSTLAEARPVDFERLNEIVNLIRVDRLYQASTRGSMKESEKSLNNFTYLNLPLHLRERVFDQLYRKVPNSCDYRN